VAGIKKTLNLDPGCEEVHTPCHSQLPQDAAALLLERNEDVFI
jgi:hypothetical protein